MKQHQLYFLCGQIFIACSLLSNNIISKLCLFVLALVLFILFILETRREIKELKKEIKEFEERYKKF